MSFVLIEERQVKAARKAHHCIWCGESIPAGSSYTYERSVFEGTPQSHHWHPECLEYMREIGHQEGGEVMFDAHNEERPAAGKTEDQK